MIRIAARRMNSSVAGGNARLIFNAQENVNKLLEQHDRSSYILAQYIPEPARNAFLAIRAFNLEINKISDSSSVAASATSKLGISPADMKFKFWSDLLTKIFNDRDTEKSVGEPIGILLQDSLRNGINLDLDCFLRFLQTRNKFLKSSTFSSVNDICSYGEGTYSQLNYLTQEAVFSPGISPSTIRLLEYSSSLQAKVNDIAAHIGQATAVSSMILGVQYYGSQRNKVTLPVDLMTKYDLSQESLLRLCQGHVNDDNEVAEIKEQLKNIVFDTAVTANDHLLSARDKLSKCQAEIVEVVNANKQDKLVGSQFKKWKRNIPDALFTPFMVAIPTSLYLQKLQKCDFDIFHGKLQQKEWRLPWTSFRSYYQRKI